MSTGIEWTDETWNPTTGCTKVSPGCDNCYAEVMYERFNGKGSFATVKMHSSRLAIPFHWRKPRKVFVNSMSDLFHQDVTDFFIAEVFAVMHLNPRHTFQILTKRHARMRSLLNSMEFRTLVNAALKVRGEAALPGLGLVVLPNVWLGVSVENQQWADIRIRALLCTPAAIRFLSCEPVVGPVDLAPDGLLVDWVIVGGESGRGARPMHPAWARTLRDQCEEAGVPFLFKQWGEWTPDGSGQYRVTRSRSRYEVKALGPNGEPWTNETVPSPAWAWLYRKGKHAAGRELDGRTWDEYPATREDTGQQATTADNH